VIAGNADQRFQTDASCECSIIIGCIGQAGKPDLRDQRCGFAPFGLRRFDAALVFVFSCPTTGRRQDQSGGKTPQSKILANAATFAKDVVHPWGCATTPCVKKVVWFTGKVRVLCVLF
jgi:hypothetical protein